MTQAAKKERDLVVDIVRAAGGEIVGKSKFQKIAYFLEITGQGSGFDFEYKHYGPYSVGVSDALRTARIFGLVAEEERVADWGGHYSIFKIGNSLNNLNDKIDEIRSRFAEAAAQIGSVELELAATAVYLYSEENCQDPWGELKRRKPEKAVEEKLNKAKEAYKTLASINTPKSLPAIA